MLLLMMMIVIMIIIMIIPQRALRMSTLLWNEINLIIKVPLLVNLISMLYKLWTPLRVIDFNVLTSTDCTLRFYVPLTVFMLIFMPTGTDLFTLSSLVTMVPPCSHGPLGPLQWASVMHDCTSHSCIMEHRTPYQHLGLDGRAKKQDITLAYQRLAKLYHPDKNTSPKVTALFKNSIRHTIHSQMTSSVWNTMHW